MRSRERGSRGGEEEEIKWRERMGRSRDRLRKLKWKLGIQNSKGKMRD